MGIKSNVTRGVGSLFSNNNAAKRHVLANRAKYGIGASGTRARVQGATKAQRRASSGTAQKAMNTAIAQRQSQVGRRVLTGGALLGGAGMMRNRDGSRGGYNGPRGSGRYA